MVRKYLDIFKQLEIFLDKGTAQSDEGFRAMQLGLSLEFEAIQYLRTLNIDEKYATNLLT